VQAKCGRKLKLVDISINAYLIYRRVSEVLTKREKIVSCSKSRFAFSGYEENAERGDSVSGTSLKCNN